MDNFHDSFIFDDDDVCQVSSDLFTLVSEADSMKIMEFQELENFVESTLLTSRAEDSIQEQRLPIYSQQEKSVTSVSKFSSNFQVETTLNPALSFSSIDSSQTIALVAGSSSPSMQAIQSRDIIKRCVDIWLQQCYRRSAHRKLHQAEVTDMLSKMSMAEYIFITEYLSIYVQNKCKTGLAQLKLKDCSAHVQICAKEARTRFHNSLHRASVRKRKQVVSDIGDIQAMPDDIEVPTYEFSGPYSPSILQAMKILIENSYKDAYHRANFARKVMRYYASKATKYDLEFIENDLHHFLLQDESSHMLDSRNISSWLRHEALQGRKRRKDYINKQLKRAKTTSFDQSDW